MWHDVKERLQEALAPQQSGGGGGSWQQHRALLSDALLEIQRLEGMLLARQPLTVDLSGKIVDLSGTSGEQGNVIASAPTTQPPKPRG